MLTASYLEIYDNKDKQYKVLWNELKAIVCG